MSARTRFNVTIEDRYTRYGQDGLELHLYDYPVTVNNDYTVTGTRATDSDDEFIKGSAKGDGQYDFSDVAYGEYVIIAYRPGIIPQVVNGYDRFHVVPKFASDEIAGSETDIRDLKEIINVLTAYILENDAGWTGTPPTLIG